MRSHRHCSYFGGSKCTSGSTGTDPTQHKPSQKIVTECHCQNCKNSWSIPSFAREAEDQQKVVHLVGGTAGPETQVSRLLPLFSQCPQTAINPLYNLLSWVTQRSFPCVQLTLPPTVFMLPFGLAFVFSSESLLSPSMVGVKNAFAQHPHLLMWGQTLNSEGVIMLEPGHPPGRVRLSAVLCAHISVFVEQ